MCLLKDVELEKDDHLYKKKLKFALTKHFRFGDDIFQKWLHMH